MKFRILGALELRDRRGQLLSIGGYKQRALLAALLLDANRLVAVQRLVEDVWAGEPADVARHKVHLAVHRLRRVLAAHGAEELLVTKNGGYLLRVAPGALDSDRFAQLIEDARESAAAGRHAEAVARYDEALALWQGEPLGELSAEEFAQPAIARLEALHLAAVTERAEAALALGRHAELLPTLEELTRRYPLQERLARLLILALYRCGRQADALAAYQAARERLTGELGIEPAEELQRLQRAILLQDPTLSLPSVTAGSPAGAGGQAADAAPPPPGDSWSAQPPAAASPPAGEPGAPASGAPGADRPAAGQQPAGERRTVTVLAARVLPTGEGEGGWGGDPEEEWLRHGTAVDALREQIAKLGGVVHTDLGETLLATFGARRTHADDPARAVRAALESTVGRLGDANAEGGRSTGAAERAGGAALAIGIDTGEAVVTLAGADEAPRVTGEVVRAAAALADAAREGGVLVGETTARATEGLIEYRPPAAPSGGPAAWEAVGTEAAPEPGVPPAQVVGRERELALLTDVLDRARTELEPQLVTVIGTPGLGKTRLLQELRSRSDPRALRAPGDTRARGGEGTHSGQGMPPEHDDGLPQEDDGRPQEHGDHGDDSVWLIGHSPPYGDGVSFWALAEIVKASIDMLATDTVEEARRKLDRTVRQLMDDSPESRWVSEYLEPLIGSRPSGDADAGRRREAFLAWRSFLEALANQHPLVLVLEDLQWADDALLDFIEHLADHSEAVPLLVVCLAWPELLDRRPGWGGGKRNATTISLAPLSDTHTARMLDQLLAAGTPRLDGARRAQLLLGSGGNPLFVEEYVRMLRGRSAVEGGTPATLVPPETVQLLIGARLDDLERPDRALLSDAAVLGDTMWSGALAAISDRDPATVAAALRRLTRRDFLRRVPRSSIPGQVEYAFRHGLIREVAYGRLLRADRAQRHRRAAEWLETLGADRASERAELIAYHYVQAVTYVRAGGRQTGGGAVSADAAEDLADRAVRALRRAGERALSLAAYPAALRYLNQALELWPEERPGRLELLLAREDLRFRLEHDADPNVLLEAREGLLAAGDHVGAANAQALLAQLTWLRGRVVLAADQEQRAYDLARAAPPSRGKARVLATIGFALCNMSRFPEALQVGREALALARPLGMRRTEAAALGVVGMSRAVLGDRMGIADARRSVTVLEELRAAHTPAAYGMLGAVLSYLGDLAGMSQALADTRRTVARFESRAMLVWVDAVRVGELYWWGRWDEALEQADRQIGRHAHGAGRYVEVWCRCLRGKIRLALGDAEGALDDAVAALEIARHADEHTLFPAAAFRAYLLTLGVGTAGDEVKGRPQEDLAQLAADLRGRLSGHLVPPFTGVELAAVLAASDTPPEAVPDRLAGASLWLGALRSYLAGAHVQAADAYLRIGSRPDEAFARLRAGEQAAARGQAEEAAAQLTRARDFYQPLGATRYLDRIDALLERGRDG